MSDVRIFGAVEVQRSNLERGRAKISEIFVDRTCMIELQRLLPNRRSRTKLRRFDHLRHSRRDRNLGLGVRDVELSRRSLATGLHEINFLLGVWFSDQTPDR